VDADFSMVLRQQLVRYSGLTINEIKDGSQKVQDGKLFKCAVVRVYLGVLQALKVS